MDGSGRSDEGASQPVNGGLQIHSAKLEESVRGQDAGGGIRYPLIDA
jgi:hypothetical protein